MTNAPLVRLHRQFEQKTPIGLGLNICPRKNVVIVYCTHKAMWWWPIAISWDMDRHVPSWTVMDRHGPSWTVMDPFHSADFCSTRLFPSSIRSRQLGITQPQGNAALGPNCSELTQFWPVSEGKSSPFCPLHWQA